MYTELGQTLTHNQCGWNWDLLSIYSTLMNAHVSLRYCMFTSHKVNIYKSGTQGTAGWVGRLRTMIPVKLCIFCFVCVLYWAHWGHFRSCMYIFHCYWLIWSTLLSPQSFGKYLMGGTASKGCHQGGVLFSCWPVELLKQLPGTAKPS